MTQLTQEKHSIINIRLLLGIIIKNIMSVIQMIILACLLGLVCSQSGGHYETIVIGGGIAGVTAAVEVAKSGQKVAILEANNYIGGRLKTTPVTLQAGGQVQFDEGASWIHGSCPENPITQLSKSVQGLVTVETDDGLAETLGEDGSDVQAAADTAFTTYQDLLTQAEDHDPSESLQSVFQSEGGAGVLADKYFMFHVSNDVEFQTSGSIDKLAGNGPDDDEFPGTQELVLSGYQRFVETLVKQADVAVFLNNRVRKVSWKGTQSEIVTQDGVTYYARYVVMAVPLGVLKKKVIQFSPPLPSWKSEAIDSLGFGNVCKILIDFPDATFTSSTNHYIGVVSDDVTERGLATYFLNLKELADVPALMTFGLGANANDAEDMDLADLKDFINDRLSAFAVGAITADTFNIARTSWGKNPNFFGTYTYAATTTRAEHWQNMAKRIEDSNLYFCGEHTYSKYRGTVHGAYLSGINAANQVKEKANKIKIIIIVVCTVGGVLLIVTGVLIYFKCRKPVPSPDTANVNAEPNYDQSYNNVKPSSGIDNTAVYSMEVMGTKAA